jgi:hypothetical protein
LEKANRNENGKGPDKRSLSPSGGRRGLGGEQTGNEETLSERELAVVLRFIAQPVLALGAGRLERNLDSAFVVATVAGAEIPGEIDILTQNPFQTLTQETLPVLVDLFDRQRGDREDAPVAYL